MSLLRYSATFISWRKCELQAIDRKTRRLFTIYGGLHPKSDVDRLYIPRKDRRRGLIAVGDCVELAVRGLEVYVSNVLKKAKKEKRLQNCEEKALYCQYLRQTKEVRSEQIWVWLQNRYLKRETESLIVAAEN